MRVASWIRKSPAPDWDQLPKPPNIVQIKPNTKNRVEAYQSKRERVWRLRASESNLQGNPTRANSLFCGAVLNCPKKERVWVRASVNNHPRAFTSSYKVDFIILIATDPSGGPHANIQRSAQCCKRCIFEGSAIWYCEQKSAKLGAHETPIYDRFW